MASDSVPHIIRTAADSRQNAIHTVFLSDIQPVNSDIRLIRLSMPANEFPFRHLPGQWVDVYIPGVNEIGGFTITSAPSTSLLAPLNRHPYFELAIQRSPQNPPAAFFWRPFSEISGTELQVRIGGNFVWPPPKLLAVETVPPKLKRVIFIAGGVGINPLMSMLSSLSENGKWPANVFLFYSVRLLVDERNGNYSKTLDSILFFTRLNAIVRDARTWSIDFKFRLIITGVPADHKPLYLTPESRPQSPISPRSPQSPKSPNGHSRIDSDLRGGGGDSSFWSSAADVSYGERLQWDEIKDALGNEEQRKDAVVYICGPQKMTDEIVEELTEKEGLGSDRVLCEKWW